MCGDKGGSCTASQVATHNSAADCWVIYDNGYYNITPFIGSHPGGSSVFDDTTCGHDISQYLSGASAKGAQQHNHNRSAYATFKTYYVGPVTN
jgi:cytochrome b involved in lipid metabolism